MLRPRQAPKVQVVVVVMQRTKPVENAAYLSLERLPKQSKP